MPGSQRCRGLPLSILLSAALGAAFRLCHIASQVLVDDEWHGLYFVIDKTAREVLTRFSVPGATCIPLNAYAWGLLHTLGWNETLLRLPSLVAGIGGLILLPLLDAKLFGTRSARLFAALLAIAPFLIFYSRMCRPYSAVALLAPVAILSACLWLRDGGAGFGAAYVLCAVGAVYFHLFALPIAVAPLVGLLLPRRFGICLARRPLFIAGAALAALVTILVGPALLESLRTTMPTLMRTDAATWRTAMGSAMLLSGTPNPVLTVLFLLLLAAGAWRTGREQPATACVLGSAAALSALSLAISRPDGMHAPIVLSRYFIGLFPLAFALVALGWDTVVTALERVARPASPTPMRAVLTLAFAAALLVAGPQIHLCLSGTSFSNQVAYQQFYMPLTWDESFTSDMTPPGDRTDVTVSRGELSPFWEALAQDHATAAIIEFPMLIGDHFNPHYYYQHFHHKRVIVGYVTDFPMRVTPGAGRYVYGNTYVDEVLGLVDARGRSRLHNLIDLDDLAAIRRSPAGYVVLHKRFEAELPSVYGATPSLDRLTRRYRAAFGAPAFEDAHLVAFRIAGGMKK